MNPSPMRYPGGKYKMYEFVKCLMEYNGDSTYIEPFCGGAAVGMKLLQDDVVKEVIINDYDFAIYALWYSILNKTDELCNLIEEKNVCIDEWYKQREIYSKPNDSEIVDVGFATLFLNRTNRSGIVGKAGPIGGKKQNGKYKIDCRFNKKRIISQIKDIASYRESIQLYNMEAVDFIEKIIPKTRKSFTFFDPPYYNKGVELYVDFYTHGDHENLGRIIKRRLKNRDWIVTYDNVDAVKLIYKNIDRIDFNLRYSLQKKRVGREVLFFSPHLRRIPNEEQYLHISG